MKYLTIPVLFSLLTLAGCKKSDTTPVPTPTPQPTQVAPTATPTPVKTPVPVIVVKPSDFESIEVLRVGDSTLVVQKHNSGNLYVPVRTFVFVAKEHNLIPANSYVHWDSKYKTISVNGRLEPSAIVSKQKGYVDWTYLIKHVPAKNRQYFQIVRESGFVL